MNTTKPVLHFKADRNWTVCGAAFKADHTVRNVTRVTCTHCLGKIKPDFAVDTAVMVDGAIPGTVVEVNAVGVRVKIGGGHILTYPRARVAVVAA